MRIKLVVALASGASVGVGEGRCLTCSLSLRLEKYLNSFKLTQLFTASLGYFSIHLSSQSFVNKWLTFSCRVLNTSTMSSEDLTKAHPEGEEVGIDDPLYKPPPVKSLTEIVQADEDDESLRKYKETLLGHAAKDVVIVDANNPSRVIVKALALVVEGRDDIVLDLSGDLSKLKKTVYRVKEGIQYKVRIDFFVQREIVTGLKYVQKILKHGLQVEKMVQMVGSYAPKLELQSYLSPLEEMPTGMLARGSYTVKSLFTDDDKNEHLKWEWSFELKKDWD